MRSHHGNLIEPNDMSKMALVGHSITLFGNVGLASFFKVSWCLYVKIRVTGHENQKLPSGQITLGDPKKQKTDQTNPCSRSLFGASKIPYVLTGHNPSHNTPNHRGKPGLGK
jgi:hypothetical protein